jgi:hypothetical protein
LGIICPVQNGATDVKTAETLRLFWTGLSAVLVGTWLGLKLYRPEEAIVQIVALALLLLSGLALRPWWWSRET